MTCATSYRWRAQSTRPWRSPCPARSGSIRSKGFVKLAREQPGKLNWAATTGLPLYVVAALQKVAKIDITQISYRDFGPAFQDFATGRVQLLATGITPLLPQVQSGRGRFVLITNSARSPLAPEVPTP